MLFHWSCSYAFLLLLPGEEDRNIRFGIVLSQIFRFSTNPYFSIDPRNRGQAYIREAERLFDLHDLSEQTLRAALLLGTYYGTEGDPQRENLYYTVASRLGLLLNVPKLPSPDTLGRELHVRCKSTIGNLCISRS